MNLYATSTCKICDEGTLKRQAVPTHSPEATKLGWIIWCLGFLLLVYIVAISVYAFSKRVENGTRWGIEWSLLLWTLVGIVGSISFVALGCILKQKKTVLLCQLCGAITPAQ